MSEYKVGTIIGGMPQKFIVKNRGETLTYHAREICDKWKYHKDIERETDGCVIYGGGYVKYSSEEKAIILHGKSKGFGEVPQCFLEGFASLLLKEYKKTYKDIEKIIIEEYNPRD